jgi:hypothetical protein
MAIPVTATRESTTTTLNTPKRLFQGGEHGFRSSASITCRDDSPVPLKVRIVRKTEAAPSDCSAGQETNTVFPSETFRLGDDGSYLNDIYVWGAGGAVANYMATELV